LFGGHCNFDAAAQVGEPCITPPVLLGYLCRYGSACGSKKERECTTSNFERKEMGLQSPVWRGFQSQSNLLNVPVLTNCHAKWHLSQSDSLPIFPTNQ